MGVCSQPVNSWRSRQAGIRAFPGGSLLSLRPPNTSLQINSPFSGVKKQFYARNPERGWGVGRCTLEKHSPGSAQKILIFLKVLSCSYRSLSEMEVYRHTPIIPSLRIHFHHPPPRFYAGPATVLIPSRRARQLLTVHESRPGQKMAMHWDLPETFSPAGLNGKWQPALPPLYISRQRNMGNVQA